MKNSILTSTLEKLCAPINNDDENTEMRRIQALDNIAAVLERCYIEYYNYVQANQGTKAANMQSLIASFNAEINSKFDEIAIECSKEGNVVQDLAGLLMSYIGKKRECLKEQSEKSGNAEEYAKLKVSSDLGETLLRFKGQYYINKEKNKTAKLADDIPDKTEPNEENIEEAAGITFYKRHPDLSENDSIYPDVILPEGEDR